MNKMMASSTKRAWKLQEFVAHGASVNCLSLGRKSGRVMVTGGEDRKVNLWAVGKPNCIMSLTGHTTPVECVKFGHLEDLVCAGSMSGALKIWDLEAAKILRTLTGHKSNVRCLDFHPYGDFIASGSLDTNIKLWDIRRKGCIYTYKGHSKAVNSLSFSPDGRWIASGGDDGIIKLWDLPAGKMLTEFRSHTGPITDIEFHPNEFLLATGSQDKTVKFWDLESFQLVSSTDGDSTPIRCIYFHSGGDEGEVLFSGAQDVLKVYGWEPARCFDSLSLGWGKVSDITTSQNQLIAGSYSLTTVSIYVVDLKRVQPFGTPATHNNSFQPNSSLRKSFSKTRPMDVPKGEEDDVIMPKAGSFQDSSIALAPPNCDSDQEDQCTFITQKQDYNAIFHPNRELTRTPPKEEPFPCPIEEALSQTTFSSSPTLKPPDPEKVPSELPTGSQPAKTVVVPTRHLSTLPSSGQQGLTTRPSTLNISSKPCVVAPPTPSAPIEEPSSPMKPPTPMSPKVIHPTLNNKPRRNDMVSVVKPEPQKAIVLPEQKPVEFIPDQRERPADLDLEEFLPRHLQHSLRIGGGHQPAMSEAEAISTIVSGHQSMVTVLGHRLKSLQIVLAQWSSKDCRSALENAVHMGDASLMVDILNAISLRPNLWNLDMCQILLPAIYDLLQSKYEAYMAVGCGALKLILKNFCHTIKTNLTAPPGIGVDVTREERYNKCMSCYNHLLSIRAFLLKRQTLQGKLGQSFRELHILMQGLE